ncbi:WG repeat-containing protein [Salinicola sp. CPA57]|uniref:WG repeat-containing protein n=1 Tax=Salinicola sp. CPA57 TaxID=1949080 RepID=UPI000DA23ADF|nr:WG repeat-containing protein [Salinicola sp. CPA57]
MRQILQTARFLGSHSSLVALLLAVGSILLPTASADADSPHYLYDNDAMTVRSLGDHAQILDTETGEIIADHVLATNRIDDWVLVYTGDGSDTPYTAKKGILSSKGRWILKPVYDGLDVKRDSDAFVVERDGHYGVFGLDGVQRTPIEYDRLPGLLASDDLWIAERGQKVGVVNPRNGEVVAPMDYDDIQIWNGLALASTFEPDRDHRRTTVYNARGDIVAGVEREADVKIWREPKLLVVGQRVLDPATGESILSGDRYDKIDPIEGSDAAIVKLGDKMGLIGADGHERIAPTYALIYPLNAGEPADIYLRVAPDAWPDGGGGKVGVADIDGREIIPAEWDGLDLITVKRWEGDPTQHFFYTRRDHHFGSIDTNGDTILPADFDSARRLSNAGQVYRVIRDGKTGICSLLTGECPVETAFDAVNVFEDDYRRALFDVVKANHHGLITQSGKTLIPVEAGAIRRIATDTQASSIRIAIVDAEGLRGALLTYDEAAANWQLSSADVSTDEALERGAYDGQFSAQQYQPTITARYLPEDYTNAEAVVKGVSEGNLRELVYPSLQLSSDEKAYAFFNAFKGMDQALNGSLPVCPNDGGFDILLISPQYNDASCALIESDERLHFARGKDGSLHCAACAARGIPTDWVERGPERVVSDHCATATSDSLGIDQALYDNWLQRFASDIASLQKAFKENDNWIDDADFSRLRRSSIDMETRAPHNVARGLMKSAGQLDSPDTPDIETLLTTFEHAEPAGYGGMFPETQSQYQNKCQQVWYLRLPALEDAINAGDSHPAGLDYSLPNDSTFERQTYPYALFSMSGDRLRLTGISRELAAAIRWIAETRSDATQADAKDEVVTSP